VADSPSSYHFIKILREAVREELRRVIREELTSGDAAASELVNAILKEIRDKVATEATLSSRLDVALSELRDSLRGADAKDFSTLQASVDGILAKTDVSLSSLRDALRPSRSQPTRDLEGYTLGGGEVVEVTKSDLEGWSALVVTVRATYGVDATAGVRVRWLYSQDGVNYDSPEDAELVGNYSDLSFSAGAARQQTIPMKVLAPYIKVQIANLDPANAVVIDAWSLTMR